MLRTYAGAVAKMMAKAEQDPGDPSSWLFQWYTHGVKQPWQQPISFSFKQSEIARIYPNSTDPRRALASAMWDTCPHYAQPEQFFLPWHRMYVFYFEQLVRAISGVDAFTLPYWDYTDPAQHAIPVEFRQPTDAVFKSLFRAQRGAAVNAGQPIDGGGANTFLNLNDMVFAHYLKQPGDVGGFCPNLEANLHGNVHTHVGMQPPASDLGMTFVPTAANDPIFWLHHCNIDRIWASWNKAGGSNPTDSIYVGQPFTFADTAGKAVQKKAGEVSQTEQLDYVYDQYLARPPGSQPFPTTAPVGSLFALAIHARSAATAGPIALTGRPTSVTLAAQDIPSLPSAGSLRNFSIQLDAAAADRQVFLSIAGMTAKQEPGVVYDVYLDPLPGASLNRADPGYLGTLNFFGAIAHGDHDHSATGQSIGLVATDAVKRLRAAGRLTGNPTVALVPRGTLVEAAVPMVGSIALVSQ